jgi:hypothetical protein
MMLMIMILMIMTKDEQIYPDTGHGRTNSVIEYPAQQYIYE